MKCDCHGTVPVTAFLGWLALVGLAVAGSAGGCGCQKRVVDHNRLSEPPPPGEAVADVEGRHSLPPATQAPDLNNLELVVQRGHTGWLGSVAFSPDGRWIVSGARDESAILWDVATGRRLRSYGPHGKGVTSVALSPNGRQVLTAALDAA